MGVSGCGKTTLATAFAKRVKLPFYDGDDFHATEHIEKMEAGNALTDDDRIQWLDRIGRQMEIESVRHGAVLACSALKDVYRQQIEQAAGPGVIWIYLKGSRALITQRLAARKNHFFNVSLVGAQFEILEEPMNAVYLDCELDTETQLDALLQILGYPLTT